MYFVTLPSIVNENVFVALGSEDNEAVVSFESDAAAAIIFANSVQDFLDRFARQSQIVPFASASGILYELSAR